LAALERNTWIIIVVATALVAAGLWGLSSLTDESPGPSHFTAAATVPPTVELARVEAFTPAPVPSGAVDKWSKDDSLATVMARYREAKDLRVFYDRARQVGGMANLWAAQTAQLRCQRVGTHGRVAAVQEVIAYAAPMPADGIEALSQWLQPCFGFETQPLPPGEFLAVYRALRASEGLIGEGYRLSPANRTVPLPEAEQKEFLRRVVASGEPELIALFGTQAAILRAGPIGRERADGELDFRTPGAIEAIAWQLAACDLGAHCGPGSEIWLAGCAAGDCGSGAALRGLTAEFDRDTASAIARRRDEILAAIKARDWAALGL